jgi:putative membrane protein
LEEQKKKKINAKKLWLIIILISIVLVPAFYGFTYLKSYWTNGTTINQVPIAVVNLDQPYTKDGKTYDVGSTVINNLKTNTTLGWKFVSYKEGEEGLYGSKYYAMLVIPKDFSKEIADATTDGFKKPKIDFYQNQGKNYIFSQISGMGAEQVKQSVSQSISKSVSSVLVETIYKSKDGFKTASDGASQLETGVNKLSNGSKSLVSGMTKLEDGSENLGAGVNKLSGGSEQLVSGVNKLSNGSTQLVGGLNKLSSGSETLVGGVNKLQGGSKELVGGVSKLQGGSESLVGGVSKLQGGSETLINGVSKLQGGSQKLVNGVNELKGGSQSLVSGIKKLSNGSQSLENGAQKLQDGSQNLVNGMQKLKAGAGQVAQGQAGISKEMEALKGLLAAGQTKEANALLARIAEQNKQLQQGVSSLSSGISNASTGAKELNGGVSTLNGGISSLHSGISKAASGANALNGGLSSVGAGASALNSGLGQVSEGANALNSGLGQVSQGANALNSGLGQVSQGANALNSGLGQVSEGANALNGGLGQVSEGANSLNTGLDSAKSGANALNSGLKTVGSGVSTLNNGLKSAGSGASELNNGLDSAKSGVSKLSSGLKSGYNNLNDNVTFTAAQMSEFISNPVVLNTITINPVSSYGEGFAPYFMCIGLWVGVMYVYFMVSALSRKFKGSFLKRFGKMYAIGITLSVLQALILTTVAYFGLGMQAVSLGWLYGVVTITSIAIFSLMNGLHYIMAPIMKGALVVIMVLQFTACGGSYPVLVMPTFYQAIHPFLILSYGVNSIRMALSGINYDLFYKYIGILVLFIVASTLIGYIVGYTKNHITHRRILKEKESELIDEKEAFNQFV